MLLSRDDAGLFYKLHHSLLQFVVQSLDVVPDMARPADLATLSQETILEARKAILEQTDLIESFVDQNSANLSDDEIDIVLSWRHQVFGRFYVFRQLKKYMVFLSTDDPPVAYGVTALTDPFELLLGPNLPAMTETVLMPFKDKIIYDGLLRGFNITFGPGIKRRLQEDYRDAKERLGIVTSLPIQSIPISAPKTKKKRKSQRATRSGAKDVQPVLEDILAITDGFCREHLNDEYAELCGKLAEKLSRKRPSPLPRGMPKTWACGILRAIGWVNFLDDPSMVPHLKFTAIDEALGVSQSTGQSKSLEIRKMLKMDRFDVHWTLPSRMEENPLVWMIEVNGFILDMRDAPRDMQEVAFEKGLIPYIPADREAGRSEDDEHNMASSGQLLQ